MGLASGGKGENDVSTTLKPDADYGIFDVRAKRTENPINPPAVDRQRLYKGWGGGTAMGATPRLKSTGGGNLNKNSPGGFKVRKRTLKG